MLLNRFAQPHPTKYLILLRSPPLKHCSQRTPLSSRVHSADTVFEYILAEGLQGATLRDATFQSVPTSLFVSHATLRTRAIFRATRKTLIQAGVETSHTFLVLQKNSSVVHKCSLGDRVREGRSCQVCPNAANNQHSIIMPFPMPSPLSYHEPSSHTIVAPMLSLPCAREHSRSSPASRRWVTPFT